MERSKVICHMYVSIDGKIDGRYMDEDDRSDSGEFYDVAIWEMGNANANGRNTAEMYFAHEDIDYSKYDTAGIEYEDHVIRSDYYWVIFDNLRLCYYGSVSPDDVDGINSPTATLEPEGKQGIYSIDGRKISDDTNGTHQLPAGIYIINGKKHAVK